jgi:hypothetical protein
MEGLGGRKMSKVSNYSEVDAMRDADVALGNLASDTDAQRRVIQWLAAKYAANLPMSELRRVDSAMHQVSDKPQDIKSFMSLKRPLNNYERVACLAYYLEKFKDIPDVGSKEIVEANTEARLPKMSNPAVFIKHATHTYGYLNSIGQRRLVVSSRGEAVVEALPERAKVDEVLENFPFGKKGRTGKKRRSTSPSQTD